MKKKSIRIIFFAFVVCAAIGGFIGYRMYNKPHRSAETEKAVALTSVQLAADYEKDENSANKKYLGNAVEISGVVADMSTNQQNKPVIVLSGTTMSGVQCTMENNIQPIKKGDAISIKGFCNGYLTDVIVDRCIIAKQ